MPNPEWTVNFLEYRGGSEIDIAPEYLYEHGKDIIRWSEFVSQDNEDIRDGMSPEDYVRKLRDFDRE